MENFNKLMSCLKEIDPDTCPNISVPLDLTVMARTLQEYASEVGQLWKNIIEIMVTSEPVDTANFVRMVCETVQGESAREDHEKILLAVNVLESLQEYYSLACSESSRSATATRRQVLQAMTGSKVRGANQINQLAETIGARPHTVYNEAKARENIEERKQIVPYLKILARKSP